MTTSGPPPKTASNGTHPKKKVVCSTKKHGKGLCFECGYVGKGTKNEDNTDLESNKTHKVVYSGQNYITHESDSDDTENDHSDSDSSDDYTSIVAKRKAMGKNTTHAALVAALTRKKPRSQMPISSNNLYLAFTLHLFTN